MRGAGGEGGCRSCLSCNVELFCCFCFFGLLSSLFFSLQLSVLGSVFSFVFRARPGMISFFDLFPCFIPLLLVAAASLLFHFLSHYFLSLLFQIPFASMDISHLYDIDPPSIVVLLDSCFSNHKVSGMVSSVHAKPFSTMEAGTSFPCTCLLLRFLCIFLS